MSNGDMPGQRKPEQTPVKKPEQKIEQSPKTYAPPRDAAAWDKIEKGQGGDKAAPVKHTDKSKPGPQADGTQSEKQPEQKAEKDKVSQQNYARPRDAAAWDKIEGGQRRDKPLSPEEKAERQRIAHPKDGVGFGYNKDKAAPGETDRWYNSLTDKQKEALRKHETTIVITATASRPGSEKYNENLTDRRAESLKKELVDKYGVNEDSIVINPLGEERARDGDKSENKDDHDDRVATIEIVSQPEQPKKTEVTKSDLRAAVTNSFRGMPKPDMYDDFSDQKGIIKRTIVKTGKDALSTPPPELPGKAAKHLIVEEGKWVGKRIVAEDKDKDIQQRSMAPNFVPGVLDRLAELSGVDKDPVHHQTPGFSEQSDYYNRGRESWDAAWQQLSDKDKQTMISAMRTPAGRHDLEERIKDAMINRYFTRSARYSHEQKPGQ